MSEQIKDLQQAVTTILRALKIAETEVQVAHRKLNFLPIDIQTLRFVSEHKDCRLADLSKHLSIAATTASSVVDRLVERGFIQRQRPETDRRSIALSLTKEGAHAFGSIEAEEFATMALMLDALPEDERPTFVRHMMQIARKVSM